MLLNFQKRFVPLIEAGEKTHTIRAKRGIPYKVGETCHCYTGLRQRGARLLGRWECVKVESILIVGGFGKISGKPFVGITIDGNALDPEEMDALAKRDGFPGGILEMMQFWRGRLPFEGHVIHWRWK